MPGDSKPRKAQPKDAPPKDIQPDGAPAEKEPAEAELAEDVPLNRAERRARGKGSTQHQPAGRSKLSSPKGPPQSPRLWANRRSG